MKRLKRVLSVLVLLAMVITLVSPTQAYASGIAINKKKVNLLVGKTYELKISGTTAKVSWSSSNKAVASVSSKGLVTANKKGTATITAKVGNTSKQCKVTVKKGKINYSELTLYAGQTFQLSVNDLTGGITWKSSDSKVVRTSKSGYLSAVKEGTATISAKLKSNTYTCEITVVKNLTHADFNLDEEWDGYTNFISRSLDKDYSWSSGSRYSFHGYTGTDMNRGIEVGDSYEDVIRAYGYLEKNKNDNSNSDFYPKTAYPMTYVDIVTADTYKVPLITTYSSYRYGKRFYLDENDVVILIVWYRTKA